MRHFPMFDSLFPRLLRRPDIAPARTPVQLNLPELEPEAAPTHTAARNRPDLIHNLHQGVRTALFMPIARHGIRVGWGQFMALVLLGLLLQLGWDVIHVGRSGVLALNAAPGALFNVPVLLIAAFILARLARQSEQTLLLATTFYAITLPIDLCYLLAVRWLDQPWLNSTVPNWGALLSWFAIFWLCAASGVASIGLLHLTRLRLPLLLVTMLVIGGPLSQVYIDRSLWVRPFEEAPANTVNNALENEEVFYLQAQLLADALSRIKPGLPNKTNLFFIGMAGFADQDVFMKEVQYVQQLFRQRFGTQNRSLLLINNPKTISQIPIASGTALRAALQKMAGVMNPERDILFLYLSSHGSKDFKFSLDFGNMHFNDLDPDTLRQILDDAGIEKRVIVISACYSGGFIEALKDDDTLVISAAASDKTSFGCSSEAEFTYFGQAYFRDALQNTSSFIDAFALAKKSIALREKQQGYDSSNPQISIGRNIAPILAELARQHPHGKH
jgi:hypothetical protein